MKKMNAPALLKAFKNEKDPDKRIDSVSELERQMLSIHDTPSIMRRPTTVRGTPPVKALLEILRIDKDERVRSRAAQALAWSLDVDALKPLFDAFVKEQEGFMKQKMIVAIRSIVDNNFIEIFKDDEYCSKVRDEAAKNLMEEGNRAKKYLIRALRVEMSCDRMDDDRVKGIINILGDYGDGKVVKPLIDLLNYILEIDLNENETRWCNLMAIVYAFEKIRDERTVVPMLKILNRDIKGMYSYRGTECKYIVINSLGAFGVVAIKPLMEIIFNGYNDSHAGSGQQFALEILTKISNKMALAPLYEAYHKYENEREDFAKEIKEAIDKIEKSPGKECYYCGKKVETRPLQDLKEPHNRLICLPCWKQLKHTQENPEYRTVGGCDWDDAERE